MGEVICMCMRMCMFCAHRCDAVPISVELTPLFKIYCNIIDKTLIVLLQRTLVFPTREVLTINEKYGSTKCFIFIMCNLVTIISLQLFILSF